MRPLAVQFPPPSFKREKSACELLPNSGASNQNNAPIVKNNWGYVSSQGRKIQCAIPGAACCHLGERKRVPFPKNRDQAQPQGVWIGREPTWASTTYLTEGDAASEWRVYSRLLIRSSFRISLHRRSLRLVEPQHLPQDPTRLWHGTLSLNAALHHTLPGLIARPLKLRHAVLDVYRLGRPPSPPPPVLIHHSLAICVGDSGRRAW